ncbi:hypothetical protein ASJ79_09995 [Mycobacterium sp. NAZ190054]|nr:hypothetical protein ASJ79_09995 [Mycobacterium sp. NAZ190054]
MNKFGAGISRRHNDVRQHVDGGKPEALIDADGMCVLAAFIVVNRSGQAHDSDCLTFDPCQTRTDAHGKHWLERELAVGIDDSANGLRNMNVSPCVARAWGD